CGVVAMLRLLPAGRARRTQLEKALANYLNPPLHTLISLPRQLRRNFPLQSCSAGWVQNPFRRSKSRPAWRRGGDLLTASYPISTNQWAAKAKDCAQAGTTILTAFALAVYDPHDWLDVRVYLQVSQRKEAPSASG